MTQRQDRPASTLGMLAHIFVLYGWMTWVQWSHTAAAVIWTFAGVFLFAHFYDKFKKVEGS